MTIAVALAATDRDVIVEGTVTAGPALLDSSGRRIVIQDATAAIEVLVPTDGPRPGVGVRVRVTGRMGAAYGAPRLRGDSVEGSVPDRLRLRSP